MQHTLYLRRDPRVETVATITNNQSKNVSNWFNLTTVLNDSLDGKAILKYYEKEGLILPKHKKKLNNLILEKTFSVKNDLTVSDREEIAQQISLVFHNEQSVGERFISLNCETNFDFYLE